MAKKNSKKNAAVDTSKLDPKVIAYLDEDIQNKAEFAEQRIEDFNAANAPFYIMDYWG